TISKSPSILNEPLLLTVMRVVAMLILRFTIFDLRFFRLQIADCRLQIADCRLQIADCRLQIAAQDTS
ncbi:MAG TPA: hypothetical protein VEV83_20955, partial [Parafilimonas sp.]|nr:hypothetical protein [Parafilimonas sp.]